ncbi:Endonuclease YncB, thermonuclease family [Rhizobium sp. RU33A]|uniref:thermonuclease family protein n=1 Tax=Rhizobium sp. RU33A TaxID=1907413 RepID=UPI000954D49B|nr:thermonuclease family protein [Rhizobium sp. RU33A]SIQ97452.1 Endonuclease YncB, thermonuclease family [Rhizobium sp. RU33A]
MRHVRRLRDLVLGLAILALALLVIAKLENEQALRFSGSFSVIDGDTLSADGERLRIEGIDAPELSQICKAADGSPYACGEDARRALTALVSGRGFECSGTRRDRYGRLLVVCKRGLDDLGDLLVRAGSVVADGRYLASETEARRAGEGIWRGEFERPADWRRQRQIEEAELTGWVEALLSRWLTHWF